MLLQKKEIQLSVHIIYIPYLDTTGSKLNRIRILLPITWNGTKTQSVLVQTLRVNAPVNVTYANEIIKYKIIQIIEPDPTWTRLMRKNRRTGKKREDNDSIFFRRIFTTRKGRRIDQENRNRKCVRRENAGTIMRKSEDASRMF